MEIDKALYKAQRNKAWKDRVFEGDEWEREYKRDIADAQNAPQPLMLHITPTE